MNVKLLPELRGPSGRLVSTWKVIKSPYESYRNWTERYGSTFQIPALNGDVVVTSDSQVIRAIYAARSDEVAPFAVGTLQPLLGAKSVILSEGNSHRQQRKILMPGFHGDLIAKQEEVIREVSNRVTSSWRQGEEIRVMDYTLDISLEVIIRVVFGIGRQEAVEKCKDSIVAFVKTFRPSLAFSKLLQRPLFGLSPWNRFVRSKEQCMSLLQGEIDARKESGERGDDMLSRLLDARCEDGGGIPDEQIRAQLATMLFAGHETTQIAIAWAMSWLARNRPVLNRLCRELQTMDFHEVIVGSKLLDGVCQESLRLNPIIPDSVRTLRKDLDCGEFVLPEGTNVGMLASVVHYDPQIYDKPEEFVPDRWIDRTYKTYEFFPFGGGVRRCIGATLAMLEMKVVIASWVKEFDFHLPDDAPKKESVHRRNLVVAPVSGIRLYPQKR